MRKVVMLAAAIGMFSLAVSAQEFYSEGGFGVGKGWTLGKELEELRSEKALSSDLAVEVGVKVGYGPFGGMPLYFAGEFAAMGHRFYDDRYYYQYNTYLIGPGILYYPMPRFQLAASVGYSFTSDVAYGYGANRSGSGIAYNASAGVELGTESHGLLIGVKFFNAYNVIEDWRINDESILQNSMIICAFMRYTYWRK